MLLPDEVVDVREDEEQNSYAVVGHQLAKRLASHTDQLGDAQRQVERQLSHVVVADTGRQRLSNNYMQQLLLLLTASKSCY